MSQTFDRKLFEKRWPHFKEWLLANGSAIYDVTNDYEIARFLTDRGIGVVYVNGSGRISSFQNGAREAYEAFVTSKSWKAIVKKTVRKRNDRDFTALILRDGSLCMYCPALMGLDNYTVEHIVPIASGGTNHLSNKALACRQCNVEAGHLSVRQKIEMAIRKRNLK